MGLSAIPFLGFFVPIIFLAMPTRMQAGAAPVETTEETAAAQPTAPAASDAVNPMQGETAAHPSQPAFDPFRKAQEPPAAYSDLPTGPVHFQSALYGDQVPRVLRCDPPRCRP